MRGFGYLLGWVLLSAAVLALVPAARAGYVCRGHSCYGYAAPYGYSYSYHAAGYYAGKWYPPGNYAYYGGTYYLQGYGACYGYDSPAAYYGCQPYHYEPPAYASVRDYYRDSLLSDSIAYKVLVGQAALKDGKQPVAPVDPTPAPPKPTPAPAADPVSAALGRPVSTNVPAKWKQYAADTCVRCHQGPSAKKGIDLTSLETAPAGLRALTFAAVTSGKMPEGGKPAPDDVAKECFEWYQDGLKAALVAK